MVGTYVDLFRLLREYIYVYIYLDMIRYNIYREISECTIGILDLTKVKKYRISNGSQMCIPVRYGNKLHLYY